jgi:hypothetical protein
MFDVITFFAWFFLISGVLGWMLILFFVCYGLMIERKSNGR